MLTIAVDLQARGHRVMLLTASRFEKRITDAGVAFERLSGAADLDDRDPATLPDRERYKPGIAQAQYDIQTLFIATIPEQHRSIERILAEHAEDGAELGGPVAAILTDNTWGGALPLLLEPRAARVPVIGIGTTPLSQSSRDVAPQGTGMAPSATTVGRIRNRLLGFVALKVLFAATQRLAVRMVAEVTDRPLTVLAMDASRVFDRFLQLCVPAFEYPRSDLAPNTAFVGPLPVTPLPGIPLPGTPVPGGASTALPAWWADLDGSRPVVHVTQGTVDNRDLTKLIGPTIAALAERDVTVVVSMGGRPVEDLAAELGPLPANVRAASLLPYDVLLPRTSVMVTNAGYGGVQAALRAGVPLIAAGATEEKPEVAARIAWSGVGLDLKTGTPTAARVGDAVTRILGDGGFRGRAASLASTIAATDSLALIAEEVDREVRG